MAQSKTQTIRIGKKAAGARADAPSRRISVRSALALIVPLLLMLTTGVVVWRMFSTAVTSVNELARATFAESAAGAVRATLVHFRTARVQMQQLVGVATPGEGEELLVRRMQVQLEANPAFTWVSYSRADGSFCGVYREDGRIFLNRSWPEAGAIRLQVDSLDAAGVRTLVRTSGSHDYDPRKRGFYKSAIKDGETWTQPYVFHGQDKPGITLAAPFPAAGAAAQGVFTIDMALDGLRDFVSDMKVGKSGFLYLATGDGKLLAHPGIKSTVNGDNAELLMLAQSGDPMLTELARHEASTEFRSFVVQVGQEPWLAGNLAYPVRDDLTLVVGLAAPQREFLGDVNRSLRDTALISVLALALSMAVALWFARTISRPLTRVAADMDKVGKLALDAAEAVPASFREIETMTRSLEGMKAGLRSFAGYVPRELVRELMAEGKPAQLEAEFRHMTVFFSDIEGFTGLAEKQSPAELVQLLAEYLSHLTGEIVSTGGTVDKFLGDGVMAFWNAPSSAPDHALRAVRAAVRCRRKIEELAVDPATRDFAFSTRIGVATGDMLVGNFGTRERMNYTVMGDMANVAARLEGLNKQYGTHVLVNEAAAEAARAEFVLRPIDRVAVKGRHGGGMVYEPLCELGRPEAGAAAARATAAEAAFAAYTRREFAAAAEGFEKCLALAPGDQPTQIMLSRCRELAAKPPPADWSGVFVATSK